MSISLLDIWNFIINFNLLLFIPILFVFFIFKNTPSNEGIMTALSASIFFIAFFYLIFDVWLNWIELHFQKVGQNILLSLIKRQIHSI